MADLSFSRSYWFQGPGYEKLIELRQLWLQALGGDPLEYQDFRGEQHVHSKINELARAIDGIANGPPVAVEDSISVTWTQNVAIVPFDCSANFYGDITSYATTQTPTGLSFDTNTGIFTGTPTTVSGGSALITATGPEGSADFILDWNVVPA